MINIQERNGYFRADINGSRHLFVEINGNNVVDNVQTGCEADEMCENLSEYIYECYTGQELQNNVGLTTARAVLDYASIQYTIVNGVIEF